MKPLACREGLLYYDLDLKYELILMKLAKIKKSSQETPSELRTWIEIDKKFLENNYKIFRSIIPKNCCLMSVVKSNAYGHGLIDFSKEISKLGVDWLGVDSVVEALALRREGIKKPILILGYTRPAMMKRAIENDISITISSFESFSALQKVVTTTSMPAKIHIKVDTGMHRQGFLSGDQKTLTLKIKNQKARIIIEGLYTHFASAKNPSFPKYTNTQIEQFQDWIEAFRKSGLNPMTHAAATSGTLIFPQSHFDMVRVGIGLYGLWPSPEVEEYCGEKKFLKPVLTWKTIVSEIKKVKAGSKIGYDSTETLEEDTTIAICPIGYWHGFPRALSSIGRVLVGGKRCRVIGRVSMDMISVDVSKAGSVKIGDEVVVMGRQGREEITADYLAGLADTTNYELVTRINPLIKKFYI